MEPTELTRETILKMPAGREMDELICAFMEPKPEPVPLGTLRPGDDWTYDCATRRSPSGWWETQIGFDAGDDDDLCVWEPALKPSVDIAAAWPVVEKLCKMHTQDFVFGYSMLGDRWQFSFDLKDDGCFFTKSAHGDTAPPAICRAALLTMIPD